MTEIPKLVPLSASFDQRGSFQRLFDSSWTGPPFTQVSAATTSDRGTFRGLHYLNPKLGEWKCVFVARGEILDVVFDVRSGSQKPALHYFNLSEASPAALVIPPGWAHGYLSLSEDCQVIYAMTADYLPSEERGIRFNDPKLSLDLPFPPSLVSEKDLAWPDYVLPS